jgi:hypothetical protein
MDELAKLVEGITIGADINKATRNAECGGKLGGARTMIPERNQIAAIVDKTKTPAIKTHMRINLRTGVMACIRQPNILPDGFDWSENFDYVQDIGTPIYINLKSIVGACGAQTRSLREVYWFINGQFACLRKDSSTYFANILDGDEAAKHMHKYHYLAEQNSEVKNKVYIGDLAGYIIWFAQLPRQQSLTQ